MSTTPRASGATAKSRRSTRQEPRPGSSLSPSGTLVSAFVGGRGSDSFEVNQPKKDADSFFPMEIHWASSAQPEDAPIGLGSSRSKVLGASLSGR